jgi:hypothetical protein
MLATSVGCIAVSALIYTSAHAFELTGVWTSARDACDKVFVSNGKQTTFRKNSDLYGSGFIIDGNRIRGRMANCKILKRSTKGDVINMLAFCGTDIMLSDVQLSVRVLDDDKIDRIFPGFEGSTFTYFRCPPLTPNQQAPAPSRFSPRKSGQQ